MYIKMLWLTSWEKLADSLGEKFFFDDLLSRIIFHIYIYKRSIEPQSYENSG